MARNDDPEYVRSLERALEAAELEIKGLEGELREKDKILAEMQEQLSPTHMGEPLITRPKVGAGGTALDVHGTVYFKDNQQYRAQLRFPIADGAYELVKIETPDRTHPLFQAADDTATLQQRIRSAQIAAGEDAVAANLRSMGMI
jgi:hypothetical protein